MDRRMLSWLMLVLSLIVAIWLYTSLTMSQRIINAHDHTETRQELSMLLAAMVENTEISLEAVVQSSGAVSAPWLHGEHSTQFIDCRNFWLGYGITSAVHPCPGAEAHYLLSNPETRQPLAVFDLYILAAKTMDQLRRHCTLGATDFDLVPISTTVTNAGTQPDIPADSDTEICTWIEQPSALDPNLTFHASGCTATDPFSPYTPLWVLNSFLGLIFLLIMGVAISVIQRHFCPSGPRYEGIGDDLPREMYSDSDDRDMELEQEVVRRTRDLRFVVRTIKDILDSIPSGIVVLNDRQQVLMANLGFYTIVQPAEVSIRRQPIEEILPPDFIALVARCMKIRKAEFDKGMVLPSTGVRDRRMVNVSVIPLSGKTRRVLLVLDNVTERRKLEEELRLQERLAGLGTLIAGVSHEINNPLNAVVGLVEVVLSTEQLAPSAREHITLISTYARRIADIVQDLNRYSRSAKTAEKLPTSLNDLIRDALALVRRSQPYLENITVELNLDESLPPATVNPADINQVLVNLLTNAIDALRQKTEASGENDTPPFVPTLRLGSRQRMDGTRPVLELSVEDNGPGIKPDVRNHIFDPFFTTKSHGTGLGLAISRRILEDCGASIYISTEPGDFTRFELLFEAPPARGDTRIL